MVKLNFKRILWFQTIIVILVSGMFVLWILYTLNGYLQHSSVNSLKKVVITPIKILEFYHKEELEGRLTRKEAQEKAKEAISRLRWGMDGKNYFWINTADISNIRMVMHPYKPSLNGKDITNFQDKQGNRLFHDMVRVVHDNFDGAGFVKYWWQYKGKTKRIEPKISYVKLFRPWNWIVGAGVYECDLFQESWNIIKHFLYKSFAMGCGLGILIFLFSFFTINKLLKSIEQVRLRVKDLAEGEANLTMFLDVTKATCHDKRACNDRNCSNYGKQGWCWQEVGTLSHVPKCRAIKNGELSSCEDCKVFKMVAVTELDRISIYINAFVARLNRIITEVKDKASIVTEETEKLYNASEKMYVAVDTTMNGALTMKDAAEDTSDGIVTVASSMEEMTSAINEVAQNTDNASIQAREAREAASNASKVVERLSEASHKINEITKLIASIAEQTNLLALNATIEAARAGEAGKGFSVVANEVKELAKQTGDSVVEIDEIVKAISGESKEVQDSIHNILCIINTLADLADGIVAAIEEQTATTGEVSGQTQELSHKVQHILNETEKIVSVADGAKGGTNSVKESAQTIKVRFDELYKLLNQFKV